MNRTGIRNRTQIPALYEEWLDRLSGEQYGEAVVTALRVGKRPISTQHDNQTTEGENTMTLKLKRQNGHWYVDGTVAGQRIRRSTNLPDSSTYKALAERERLRLETEAVQGAFGVSKITTTFRQAGSGLRPLEKTGRQEHSQHGLRVAQNLRRHRRHQDYRPDQRKSSSLRSRGLAGVQTRHGQAKHGYRESGAELCGETHDGYKSPDISCHGLMTLVTCTSTRHRPTRSWLGFVTSGRNQTGTSPR